MCEADFTKHRLTDWSWRTFYTMQMGEERFQAYFCRVWEALDRLKVNEYYDLAKCVKAGNRDLFIKIGCQYVLTHKEYEFNELFTKIIHRECFILKRSIGLQPKKGSSGTTPGK